MWDGHMIDSGGNGFNLLGGAFMFIFWILIIIGIFFLVKYISDSGNISNNRKTPMEILEERYAKGEIDKKVFEERKKVITG